MSLLLLLLLLLLKALEVLLLLLESLLPCPHVVRVHFDESKAVDAAILFCFACKVLRDTRRCSGGSKAFFCVFSVTINEGSRVYGVMWLARLGHPPSGRTADGVRDAVWLARHTCLGHECCTMQGLIL